jgi:hypothetical protein
MKRLEIPLHAEREADIYRYFKKQGCSFSQLVKRALYQEIYKGGQYEYSLTLARPVKFDSGNEYYRATARLDDFADGVLIRYLGKTTARTRPSYIISSIRALIWAEKIGELWEVEPKQSEVEERPARPVLKALQTETLKTEENSLVKSWGKSIF